MGSREGVAAKIETDTQQRIEEMNRAVSGNKNVIIQELLELVYDIKPEVHKNYLLKKRQGQ
jgi:V-type H+-transporting ATPase subunit G